MWINGRMALGEHTREAGRRRTRLCRVGELSNLRLGQGYPDAVPDDLWIEVVIPRPSAAGPDAMFWAKHPAPPSGGRRP